MQEEYENERIQEATKQILMRIHPLRYLFFELTRSCNLRCAHCGSRCPEYMRQTEVDAEAFLHVVDRVAAVYPRDQLMFCVTGGEPLLNPNWFKICSYISKKGFSWGMTSNGTLINEECVLQLAKAGMKTISISLDGLKETHEALRRVERSFDQAASAIRLLKESGLFRNVQAVTVVNKLNLHELPALYDFLCQLNVDSWKLTAVEPMGSACDHRELFLTEHEHYSLLNFVSIRRKRAPFDITYGCSHNLPKRYETVVRKHRFLCGAGTMIASIACNGDILPCLDINCRDQVKQGNILQDDFIEVWENCFEIFRKNKVDTCAFCMDCDQKQSCQGDSWHSWDFTEKKPLVCFKKHTVFE